MRSLTGGHMTRPSEVKPREGSVPGTPYIKFEEGKALDPVRFDITPDRVDEYMRSADADPALSVVDGRRAAPPNLLFPYLTAVLYCTYPPIQGIVKAEADLAWHHPVWAD